jgi:hypothetical protein
MIPNVTAVAKTLPTWAGRSEFKYTGSVRTGTTVWWKDKSGRNGWTNNAVFVNSALYAKMLSKLSGQEVGIGNDFHKNNLTPGTLAAFMAGFDQWGLMSYVPSILEYEGYAVRGSRRDRIRFK